MTPEDRALLSRLPEGLHAVNGVPDPVRARARERAAALASEALGDLPHPDGIRTSPLGPGWARDIDAHVRAMPDPSDLEALGWLPLDDLLGRLGSPGLGRWGVIEDGEVLAPVDLHEGAPADPVAAVLRRCRRRREVRVREVLELRVLSRAGYLFPARDPVLTAAARAEAELGGSDLAAWLKGEPALPPITVHGRGVRGLRSMVGGWHRRTLGVAVSGVDGAGKSTLARTLADDLDRLGVPVTLVWTRPGMRIGWLEGLARTGKRLLRQDPAPGVKRAAAGGAGALASRRGAVGWAWALLVTLSFLSDVRRRHRSGRGLVIYDRHVPDALATLEVAYEGVDLRLHRSLVRRLLPRAAVTIFLDVPAAVAVSRKPDEVFGEHAVHRQVDRYGTLIGDVPNLHRMDAARAPEALAREALEIIVRGQPVRRSNAPPSERPIRLSARRAR